MATLREILTIAGSLEKAEAMARDIITRDPQFTLDLELILSARGKFADAKKIIDELSEKFPEDDRIAFNKGWHLLHEGDLQQGIKLLDRGRSIGVFGSAMLQNGKALWNPETSKKEQRVLLRGEGGQGDEILNARFSQHIAAAGSKAIVSCNASLVSLFSRIEGVSKAIAHGDLTSADYDEWLPAMSAARIVGTTYETLSGKPYIKAQPEEIEKMRQHVATSEGVLKIGIRWSGNPDFEHEQFRRFPVKPLLDMSTIPGVQLYSLQRDSDMKALPPEIKDLSPYIETWEDTAGAIENLDLVITSCTSVAHLSGAMGKETWVLVPIMPYYTWALLGNKSPWYDSVRLFRQSDENNWDMPMKELKTAIMERKEKNAATYDTIAPTPYKHMSSTKKTIHFMAGLPRSGSTMLLNLLSQNPTISGAPISGLCGIMNGVFSNWDKIEFHKESPNEQAKIDTLKAILEQYHASDEKPIIIDKERHWVRFIALLEKILDRKVKIIVPVRPVSEILTSFELLRQKDPLNFTAVDEQLSARSTLATRCQYFMDDGGPIGSCYNYLKDAVISGFLDRMLFVDYNKLVIDPTADLKRIYDFLELPHFKHDFKHISQITKSDDSVWRYPGLHSVRPELHRVSQDPMKVLGPELTAQYSRIEPWEQWT